MKKILSVILTALIISLSLSGCFMFESVISESSIPRENAGLIVHFVDVGQGDCVLLESGDSFALIDAGEYSESKNVVSYLNRANVDSLEYIISTHPHSDHCGGLSEVIRNFDSSVLISPDADSDSDTWEYVLDAADERGLVYETPQVNETYPLGEATITILSPASDSVYSNLNDYSIVCKVEYKNTSFLLTGDAETVVEKELVRSGMDITADVLKCGHHGSSTSSCEEFLDAVNPSAAVVSCGKDNDYGHPHRETLDALSTRNIPLWRTDKSGTIVALSDGEKISINSAADEESLFDADSNSKPTDSSASAYIGNKNSMVFHLPSCSAIDTMNEENKVSLKDRQDATDRGYTPCGSCNP